MIPLDYLTSCFCGGGAKTRQMHIWFILFIGHIEFKLILLCRLFLRFNLLEVNFTIIKLIHRYINFRERWHVLPLGVIAEEELFHSFRLWLRWTLHSVILVLFITRLLIKLLHTYILEIYQLRRVEGLMQIWQFLKLVLWFFIVEVHIDKAVLLGHKLILVHHLEALAEIQRWLHRPRHIVARVILVWR